MKAIVKLSIVAACIAGAAVALHYTEGQTPWAESNKDCTPWVGRCLADFEAVKVGMTRSEIDSKFRMDGGLQALVSPIRYAHAACPYFKIDMEFDFKRNPADQNRPIKGKDDKVIRVSKPYIERPFVD
jgi:hypothetical protein